MAWPKDPALRAAALERHRAAQQARWSRPEERQRARDKALAQFAAPGARERHAALKRQQYQDDPTIAARIAAALKERRLSTTTEEQTTPTQEPATADPPTPTEQPDKASDPAPASELSAAPRIGKSERRHMIAQRAKTKRDKSS